MQNRRRLPRTFALLSSILVVGVLGMSLSVTAFGQDTTPLSDYTSTVPTPTATTDTQTPAPTTTAQTPTSTSTPTVSAQPQQAAATTTAPAPKKLAFTGFDIVPLLLVGAGLMGLGATLLVRRHGEQ